MHKFKNEMICCNTHYLMPKMQTVKKRILKKKFWNTNDTINIVEKCSTIFKKNEKVRFIKILLDRSKLLTFYIAIEIFITYPECSTQSEYKKAL